MTKMLKIAGVLVVASAILAGCNTVRGIGQDVQTGGAAIQDAAN